MKNRDWEARVHSGHIISNSKPPKGPRRHQAFDTTPFWGYWFKKSKPWVHFPSLVTPCHLFSHPFSSSKLFLSIALKSQGCSQISTDVNGYVIFFLKIALQTSFLSFQMMVSVSLRQGALSHWAALSTPSKPANPHFYQPGHGDSLLRVNSHICGVWMATRRGANRTGAPRNSLRD